MQLSLGELEYLVVTSWMDKCCFALRGVSIKYTALQGDNKILGE